MSNSLILGDVHIGKGTKLGKTSIGLNTNSRIHDQFKILDWVLETAVEKSCQHIFITGDVFEEVSPDVSLISLLLEWLQKCSSHLVQVHIVMGNHDCLRNGSQYISSLDVIEAASIPGIFTYKYSDTVYVDNTSFTLLPFCDRKSLGADTLTNAFSHLKSSLAYESASIPNTYCKVLIGHQAIEGSLHVGDEFDDISKELICAPDIFSGFDYVWMGHVHKYQVLKKANPYLSHIGSMDLSGFDESGSEKNIVIFNNVDKTFEVQSIPTRSLKHVKIEIGPEVEDANAYALAELAKHDLTDGIVRISCSVSEGKEFDKALVLKEVEKMNPFHLNLFSVSKKSAQSIQQKEERLHSKLDLSAAIKIWADNNFEDADEKNAFITLSQELVKKVTNKKATH